MCQCGCCIYLQMCQEGRVFYVRCVYVSPHASAGASLVGEELPTLGNDVSGPQMLVYP